MDLLPVILSIAQAEDPPSVLGQIIRAIMTNEHVALVRIWFLEDDQLGRAPVDDCLRPAADGRQRRTEVVGDRQQELALEAP